MTQNPIDRFRFGTTDMGYEHTTVFDTTTGEAYEYLPGEPPTSTRTGLPMPLDVALALTSAIFQEMTKE